MMKIVIAALLLGALSFAQETEVGGPDRFASYEACEVAMKAGKFNYYKPSFLNRHREPQEGEEVRELEEKACVEMDIVGGKGIVPQAKGEKFIFKATEIVVRYDCGNRVYGIRYVPEAQAEAPLPFPEPAPRPDPPPVVRVSFNNPPACLILGSPEKGFIGVAFSGVGEEWVADGVVLGGNPKDGVAPTEDNFGYHRLVYRVRGTEGRFAECERSWFQPPPPVAVKIKFDRDRPLWSFFPVLNCVYVWITNVKHDWGNWAVDLERAGCVAGPIVGGILLTEAELVKRPGIPATILRAVGAAVH